MTDPRLMTPPSGNAADPEIEMTPAMIEAGASAVFEWRDGATAWGLAEEVYLATERARKGLLPRPGSFVSVGAVSRSSCEIPSGFRSRPGRPLAR